MNKVHFSSNNQEWETPPEIFNKLNKEFNFTLDPCATPRTAKCSKYYTKAQDGLTKDWVGETVFINPPYGKEIRKWVEKAYREYQKGTTIVMLLPARTDTRYFHDYIYNQAEIRFLKGRIKFLVNGEELYPAPFPSMVVVFKKKKKYGFFKYF